MSDPTPRAVDPELLSAWIDGELVGDEAAAVAAWVDSDPEARATAEDFTRVRAMLRDLPMVEPSPEIRRLIERPAAFGPTTRRTPARRRRVTSSVLVSVVGAMLAWSLLLGAGSAPAEAVDVQRAVSFAAEAQIDADAAPGRANLVAVPVPVDLAPRITVPSEIGDGFVLRGVDTIGDMVAMRYQRGPVMLSVFEQPGQVDWSALPGDGRRVLVGGDPAWAGVVDEQRILVLQRGDRAYMMIQHASTPEAAREVTPDMPGESSTLLGRVGRTCRHGLEVLGLRG